MRHEFSYFPGRASLPPRLVLPGPPSPKYVGIFFTSAPARRLAARALGFARRRFSGRRFPGCRRAGCSDAARAARTGRLFGLSLRARGGGQSAYAGLADAGAQLPLLQRRAEPESQVLPLRGDGRFGLRGRADSRAFRWPARARGLLPGGKRAAQVAWRMRRWRVLSHTRGRRYFCELTARRLRKGSRFRGGLFLQAASAEQREGKSGAFRRLAPRPHRHKRGEARADFSSFRSTGHRALVWFQGRTGLLQTSRRFTVSAPNPGENAYPHRGDDPIVPPHVFPHEQVAESEWLNGILVQNGGHVGFVSGGNPRLPVYWAEERALEFLEDCLKS